MKQLAQKPRPNVQTAILLSLCFLVPALIYTLSLAAFGMAPFGENSNLIMDLSDQYVEFFCGLKEGDLFFSWGKSMGSNFVGVFAYYLSSPLTILTLLVPNSAMPIGLLLLAILKVGLAGLTMGIFLHNMGLKRHPACIFFATAYALMSYTVVYAMCGMWLDGLIWLPLVLLGTERLLQAGKMALLTVSLLGIFISNYYIAYMVGAFTALWLVYRLVTAYYRAFSGKMFWIRLSKFALSVLTAAGLGAWLLIPTLFSLMQGKIGGNGAQASGTWNFDGQALWDKLFVGDYDSITNSGAPFLYCGLGILLLVMAYFTVKQISRRERIASACCLGFLLLSLASVKLDLAWHIFQYPNWFPYRYAFVVSFFLIYLAARCLPYLRAVPLGVAVAGLILLAASGSPALGFVYILLFVLYRFAKRQGEKLARLTAGLLCGLLIVAGAYELYGNTNKLTQGLDGQFGYESYDHYHAYKSNMETVLNMVEADQASRGENAYTAVAPHFVRSINDPIGFGYRSISHYSSAYNRTTNDFFRSLGYAQSYFWSLHFGGTAVSDSLFGVGYTVNNPSIRSWANGERIQIGSTVPDTQYEAIGTYEGATVYRNPYAITAPFMVSADALNTKLEGDYFTAQNALLSGLLGEPANVLQPVAQSAIHATDNRIEVTVPSDGVLYVYFDRSGQDERTMRVGNYALPLFRNESDCIQSLGTYQAGDTAVIRVSGASDLVNSYWTRFAVLSLEDLEAVTSRLRAGAMTDFTVDGSTLSGRVFSEADGVLFTSIPYDDGWRVWIDGNEVETSAFDEALLCVQVPAGEHTVRMTYMPAGANLGLAVSVFTLAAVVSWFGAGWIRKRKAR